MKERDIGKAFVTVINAALTAQTRSDLKLTRSYSANQQAASSSPVIFFAPVTASEVVSVKSTPNTSAATRTTKTTTRETYQFTAIKTALPAQTESAFDIINLVYKLVNSYNGIRNLKAQGINIEKSAQIRHDWIENESGGQDDYASFDLTFWTTSELTETMNITDEINPLLYAI